MLFMTGSRTIAPTHELAAIYRSAAPWAEHRVLEGLGHMGPVTDPAVVNAAIRRFLSTTALDAVTAPQRAGGAYRAAA
jgi:pimeloyl-ACP methyl ester carboxylesterase